MPRIAKPISKGKDPVEMTFETFFQLCHSACLYPEGKDYKQIKEIFNSKLRDAKSLRTKKQEITGGYHRPVCPKCHCELHPETNGIGVLDLADFGPCEVWDSDLWKCPSCGVEVIGGFGQGPVARHFESSFQLVVDNYKKQNLLVENKN
jgi:ribosomal protein L37AE/L43A